MGLAGERGAPYARAGPSPRGCWFYLRYFFLFASLIQLLVILGLVLFMIYGNVHVATEKNLQATELRAQELYGQVVGLRAAQANLSKELNVTTRAKDSIMQMLLGARRDLDRINSSFRQCHTDRGLHSVRGAELRPARPSSPRQATYANNEKLIAAIILSEEDCRRQLKDGNRSCTDQLFVMGQRSKTLELELAKEKAQCGRDKDGLVRDARAAEAKLGTCEAARAQSRQEQELAEAGLQQVQALCAPLDRPKLESELIALWRDSVIPRTLDNLGYSAGFGPYHALASELAAARRSCDHMPSVMASKGDELARSLRAGIERVARENTELRRQKMEAEKGLRAAQESLAEAAKAAQASSAQLRAECARQTQLALDEKAALRQERDALAKELDAKKRQVEQLSMQVEVKDSSLDTCLRAKSQGIPILKPEGPASRTPPFDPATLEDFKKRILNSQRTPAAAASLSGFWTAPPVQLTASLYELLWPSHGGPGLEDPEWMRCCYPQFLDGESEAGTQEAGPSGAPLQSSCWCPKVGGQLEKLRMTLPQNGQQ
ncbi:plasmalemma vesicle-associated protein [Ctenodactylus gundi]